MLDHRYVNDVVDFNPTAENLARHICESIENCYKVSFQETEGNVACYVKDGEPDVDFWFDRKTKQDIDNESE